MAGAIFQMLLAGGKPKAQLNFIASVRDTSALSTTHNFSIDCGAGGNVVVAVTAVVSGTFTAVTIGGQTGTIHVQAQAGGNNAPAALASASGVSSGTQTVAVTVSGAGSASWNCFTYNLTNVGTLTPTATGSDSHTFGGCSGTLSNVALGCTAGIAMCGNGGSPVTWTGLSKDAEQGSGVQQQASAHLNHIVANSALSWSASFSGSNNQTVAVWASWGPP